MEISDGIGVTERGGFPVIHVPKGMQVLPMKVVATLKPEIGLPTKKKQIRGCVCGNFQEKKPT